MIAQFHYFLYIRQLLSTLWQIQPYPLNSPSNACTGITQTLVSICMTTDYSGFLADEVACQADSESEWIWEIL